MEQQEGQLLREGRKGAGVRNVRCADIDKSAEDLQSCRGCAKVQRMCKSAADEGMVFG